MFPCSMPSEGTSVGEFPAAFWACLSLLFWHVQEHVFQRHLSVGPAIDSHNARCPVHLEG